MGACFGGELVVYVHEPRCAMRADSCAMHAVTCWTAPGEMGGFRV